jgi:hypothetical protein
MCAGIDLVRRAAVQVGLARQAGAGTAGARTGCALRLRVISIRPSWISSIDSGCPGLLVEMLQGGGGQPRLRQVAGDPAMLAAAADGDVEGGLDLAQVFVERAAEVLQARVVERREGRVRGLGLGHRLSMLKPVTAASPRRLCGSAAVMVTSTKCRPGARGRQS